MVLRSLLITWLFATSVRSQPWTSGGAPVELRDQISLNSGVPKDSELRHGSTSKREMFHYMVDALDVMQSRFYELWIGTWPSSIDWTGAVINTAVSSTIKSIAQASSKTQDDHFSKIINKYFSHNAAYYFGEDAFSIRNEAYDDILWTVLEWLENIKTIEYRNSTDPSWHGVQFIPGFSHRARLFWDLASQGWDNDLCGGGMLWNPRLLPYKNTITNQLFISASVAMYLSSPGDTIDFPFLASDEQLFGSMPGRPHDPKYLKAAIDGYSWLKQSNMTNTNGLYVDGYHIRGYNMKNGSIGTGKCDDRNEMIYTYNQGVILSGQRGLWEATGDTSYLDDGYRQIRNVMASTGWSWSGEPNSHIYKSTKWAGMGRHGVLEELCDRSGTCSQDSQTFKGIFFQHLTQFCEPLPQKASISGQTYAASKSLRQKHSGFCSTAGQWVAHNAEAALSTKNASRGLFGMWWGYDYAVADYPESLPAHAIDYRNDASVLSTAKWAISQKSQGIHAETNGEDLAMRDVNDRGRGRTVETQQGGLAVLRASWELLEA